MVKLFLKNSNLCHHNPPTSQTDGQTDEQTTCDSKTALCSVVHRVINWKRKQQDGTNWFLWWNLWLLLHQHSHNHMHRRTPVTGSGLSWPLPVVLIGRAHSFLWAVEFRAERRNLLFAVEFWHFCRILREFEKCPVITTIVGVMSDDWLISYLFQSTYVMTYEFHCTFEKKKIISFYVANIT